MDDGGLSSLLTIAILTSAQGLLALAYGALANIRLNTFRDLAEAGNRRAEQVLQLTGQKNLRVTHQVVSSLLKVAIGGVALLGVAPAIVFHYPSLPPAGVIGVILFFSVAIVLIFGELIPEGIGSVYANGLALWVVIPIRWLVILFAPLTITFVELSKSISRALSSAELVNTVTQEEIMTLVESGQAEGTIEAQEKEMIFSVLQLDSTHVSEVMVPRIDVRALEIDSTLEEARGIFIQSGFSRIPVYEDTIDNIKGLLYAKDLLVHLNEKRSLRELMRPAYFVPETKPVDELLKELRAKRIHLAVVVDEYGGTAGIVTIENIIEEIIGDIQDEYDHEEEAEYIQQGDDAFIVDASIDIDDFNQLLNAEIPNDESDTLAGYIYSYFGRVPEVGEEITPDNGKLTMRIESVDGRRIRKVFVQRQVIITESTSNDEPRLSNTEASGR
ncbi:MAG: hemolysin family protein [Anaerolineae bacterium]|nr:hemolysin family protein [Anaerolineae bacterium]